jgi:hypothetical protein
MISVVQARYAGVCLQPLHGHLHAVIATACNTWQLQLAVWSAVCSACSIMEAQGVLTSSPILLNVRGLRVQTRTFIDSFGCVQVARGCDCQATAAGPNHVAPH